MDANERLVKNLQQYLKNNGVIIKKDAPGEFGAETHMKLVRFIEKLKAAANK